MRDSRFDRATSFENRFAKAQSAEVIDLPWGFALLHDDFASSHMHNRIVVAGEPSAAEILAETDRVLGDAKLNHRYVSVDGSLFESVRHEFAAAGYEHEGIATMAHSGAALDRSSIEVREISLKTLRPALIKQWRANLPDTSEDVLAQLADRTALYVRGAEVTFLAVIDSDEIAAHAMLFIDRAGRIAQFENLVTHPEFRGRGYANALIRDAFARATVANSNLRFLTADLDDWPYTWYQRLGYVDVGHTHHFTRTAADTDTGLTGSV